MAGYVYFGKRKLCFTEISDYTEYQGVGHDPLYRRYNSVFSIVKRIIAPELQHFLATPEYLTEVDQIYWHINEWNEKPVKLSDLTGVEHERYQSIKDHTVKTYKHSLASLSGEDFLILSNALRYIDDDRIYCCDGLVFLVAWGMTPDTNQYRVTGSILHEFDYVKNYIISFDSGEFGHFSSRLDMRISRPEGAVLSHADLPIVIPHSGWIFDGWNPSPKDQIVTSDLHYVAIYSKSESPASSTEQSAFQEVHDQNDDTDLYYTCNFDAGSDGKINGPSCIKKSAFSSLSDGEIPNVTPNKGYVFRGWDKSPYNALIDGNKVYTANYQKRATWYHSWWKWLIWAIITLLLILCVLFFFRSCVGCSDLRTKDRVTPIDPISSTSGIVVDDNGFSRSLTGPDGKLPESRFIAAPVLGEEGEVIPIMEQPGAPNIITNRLFLFLEDENGDIDLFAQDFKKAYPSSLYSIIGYDKEVNYIIIKIPELEREQIRNTIHEKISNHNFIVFDEEVYKINGMTTKQSNAAGWHIDAINLEEGWLITKGSSNVKIAIVDDGIDVSHPMFDGRIVDSYNVFTQNNKLSIGDGHGTHIAGLAAGSDRFLRKGATGVAPGCLIMPIQVFDNKYCPLSALIAGVMYAVHHEADVVNISVGSSFEGMNSLPVEQQEEIARLKFKDLERLWSRVCMTAQKKGCILVFAAGNDDILSSVPPMNRNQSSIVVSAVDEDLNQTEFTNYGQYSDISAPGKKVYSSFLNGEFCFLDGTSMAAPIVTGTIALMKTLKKDLSVLQARNVLYRTGAKVSGNIPPMVLVDKALAGVIQGDFSSPPPRSIQFVEERDYDAIRQQIKEYRKKIVELESLLPN